MQKFRLVTSLIFLCCSSLSWSQNEIHVRDVFEITWEGATIDHPYMVSSAQDAHFSVVFNGVDGEAKGKEIGVNGFWDGGAIWKVRFSPPCAGTWRYQSISPDPSLDDRKGSLTAIPWTEKEKSENRTRRGFIQVAAHGDRPGRFFVHEDGAPFLWIGDTWWNWTKRGIHLESFQKLVDDRSRKGFTVGQLFFAGRGWGRSSSLLDKTYFHPDTQHIREVETMIRYANSQGMTIWIHTWWGGKTINETIGQDVIERWWRYVVRRLSSYNVIWVLAGEYNLYNYGGFDIRFWNDLGRMIDQEDPYDRIISAHPTPPGWGGGEDAPQWSTAEVLHQEDWLDYNQCQVGHSKWRNEMIPGIVKNSYESQPAKPIVVTEPWYEFVRGNPSAEDIRFGAWSAMLSGAAGHTYGGGHVWKAHVPESPADQDSWPMEMDFKINTLDYPGAQSMSFLAKFFSSIEWWKLKPHPEYVLDNPSKYCSAIPGEEYLIFLRWGGSVKIDLTPYDSNFVFQWIDLTHQEMVKNGKMTGGRILECKPPEDYPGTLQYKDWILHIRKE